MTDTRNTERSNDVSFKLPKFVPVIFANGEDDDIPGLIAGCADEEVLYGDRVYQKGERLHIYGKRLRLKQHAHWYDGMGIMFCCMPGAGEPVDIRVKPGGREILFEQCDFVCSP